MNLKKLVLKTCHLLELIMTKEVVNHQMHHESKYDLLNYSKLSLLY